ncbi:metallophosphoesterase [Rhodopila sp.]|uniref:metallophosphoesterase n=1 Tax=Rhodopila sp. TaxID=2480087 RepID=UPI003D0B1593
MRRPGRRPAVRAALQAAAIATFETPGGAAASAAAIRFVRAPGWMPQGRRAYAIGDIHGCREALAALHRLIADDLSARPARSAVLVHLGDYINQGPDSAGVVRTLAAGDPVANLPTVNLLGDHERMLLDALDGDRAAATDWLWAGGKAALASWGLDPDLPRQDWPAALPADHVAWLRRLSLTHREGDYLFVHAGIRPGVRLADQARDDLLTIRQPFLSTEQDLGVVVVHGHASGPSVSITPNRIGLDTGAGLGGKLTCAVLEDDRIGLLAA